VSEKPVLDYKLLEEFYIHHMIHLSQKFRFDAKGGRKYFRMMREKGILLTLTLGSPGVKDKPLSPCLNQTPTLPQHPAPFFRSLGGRFPKRSQW
jgi:hypothetical protein